MMDIDAYRNFGIFSTKTNIKSFEKACDDIDIRPDILLEFFIDSLAGSFKVESGVWTKEEFVARTFYEAIKEDLKKEKCL